MLALPDSHRLTSRGRPTIRLSTGQHVERYEVEGLIGQGGLAEVYRVRHLELGHRAALKVLRRESAGIFMRTLREGRLQASLKHPNVVGVYDVLRLGESPALVIEYVAGPTLEQLLRQYQPSLHQTDALARGILAGVLAAHRAGLIHRDLKPANVLVAVESGVPVPKVADFGLARAAVSSDEGASDPRLTRQGAMLGTPAYMAPEQYSDASTVDERADVFGLGALLYELVTGVMAFPGRDAMECYRSIVQSSWRPVRELVPSAPGRMVRAIEGALEPDPEKRIATAERLLATWTGEAAGRVEPLPEVGVWEGEHVDMVKSLAPELITGGAEGDPVARTAADAGGAPSTSPPAAVAASTAVAMSESSPPPVASPDPGSLSEAQDGPSPEELRGAPGRRALVAVALLALLAGGVLLVRGGDPGGLPPPSGAATTEAAPAPLQTDASPAPTPVPSEPAVGPTAAPEPARATPARSTRTTTSAASTPAPATAPESAPASESAPARVKSAAATENVIVSGVSRAYLVADDGTRRSPGDVPPGHYVLYVFFDSSEPVRALDVEVVAGKALHIKCQAGLRSCR